MVNSKRDEEQSSISVNRLLATFFIAITMGGLFLSLGIVGLYRWYGNRPLALSLVVIIGSLVLGIIIDGWAVFRFWQQRNTIFKKLSTPE